MREYCATHVPTLIDQLRDWADLLEHTRTPLSGIIEGMREAAKDLEQRDARPNWEKDEIQFPRLLCELWANCEFNEEDWEHLCESMDLSTEQVEELFNRAQVTWDAAKGRVG